MEQADRLRRTRRYALELTDTFLPAAFLELFGDPLTQSQGWDRGHNRGCCSISRSTDFAKSNSVTQGYPVLGMGNITNKGSLDLSTLAYVICPRTNFRASHSQRGDIIFNRTNSTELVGKTACWNLDTNAVLASYLIRLRLKPEVLPEFVSALLNTGYFKNLFRDDARGGRSIKHQPNAAEGIPSITFPRFPSSRNSRPWWSESSVCVRCSGRRCARPSTSSPPSSTAPSAVDRAPRFHFSSFQF